MDTSLSNKFDISNLFPDVEYKKFSDYIYNIPSIFDVSDEYLTTEDKLSKNLRFILPNFFEEITSDFVDFNKTLYFDYFNYYIHQIAGGSVKKFININIDDNYLDNLITVTFKYPRYVGYLNVFSHLKGSAYPIRTKYNSEIANLIPLSVPKPSELLIYVKKVVLIENFLFNKVNDNPEKLIRHIICSLTYLKLPVFCISLYQTDKKMLRWQQNLIIGWVYLKPYLLWIVRTNKIKGENIFYIISDVSVLYEIKNEGIEIPTDLINAIPLFKTIRKNIFNKIDEKYEHYKKILTHTDNFYHVSYFDYCQYNFTGDITKMAYGYKTGCNYIMTLDHSPE